MTTYENTGFVQIIDNLMSSFANIFSFFNQFQRKDYTIDVYSLINKIEDKVSREEIKVWMNESVLPKMPEYVWELEDLNIFSQELVSFLEEKNLEELFANEMPQNLNEAEARRFLQDYFKVIFSRLLSVTSEQIALIRSERLSDTDLDQLKISRELIQTLELVKRLTEESLKEVNRGKFNVRKIKSVSNKFGTIMLILLRVYSISYRVKSKNIERAIKETDFLGMERIQVEV